MQKARPDDEIIKSYLIATRLNNRPPSILSGEPQKESLPHLVMGHEMFVGLNVAFVKIYSRQRETAVINLKGRHYIISDEYLILSFSILNTLLLTPERPDLLQAYLDQWAAEMLANAGFWQESFWFANKINSRLNISRKISDQVNLQQARWTFIQEVFVTAHELAHVLLNENAEKRLVTYNQVEKIAHASLDFFKLNDKQKSREEDLMKLAERLSVSTTDLLKFREEVQNIFAQYTKEENLMGELCSDTIALKVTLDICKNVFNMDYSDIVIAITLGVRHLLFFSRMQSIVGKYICEEKLSFGPPFIEQQALRMYFLFDLIMLNLDNALGTQGKDNLTAGNFFDMMITHGRKHEDILEKCVRNEFHHELKVFRNSVMLRNPSDENMAFYRRTSDLITGWA